MKKLSIVLLASFLFISTAKAQEEEQSIDPVTVGVVIFVLVFGTTLFTYYNMDNSSSFITEGVDDDSFEFAPEMSWSDRGQRIGFRLKKRF